MDTENIIQTWVNNHDELSLDGKTIRQDGERLGTFQDNGQCSIGPDDGGVRGEIVEVNEDDWLIVDGNQACYVGEGDEHLYDGATTLYDGFVQWEGRFAVQPWQPRNPEIDGPLPEDD